MTTTSDAKTPGRPRSTEVDAYRAGKVPFIDTVVAAARREAGGQSS